MIRTLVIAALLAMQSPFVETIEVRIHNVDVIVTDRAGNPVTGLRSADFDLLEDGVPQKITNFAEYSERAATAAVPAVTEAEPAPVVAPPPPRRIVFFVDEMSVHPQSRARLSKSAVAMLEQTMRPGDEAMVVRPASGVTMRLEFTGDRDAVHAVLTKAIDENTHRTNIAFENEWRRFQQDVSRAVNAKDRDNIARRHASYVRQRVEQRLANLRAVVATMSPIPGRKILIAVTESLPAQPGREFFAANRKNLRIAEAGLDSAGNMTVGDAAGDFKIDFTNLRPAIDELARNASSNGVTIFTLQPEFDLRIAPAGDGAPPLDIVQLASGNTANTLNVLAEKTGGKFFPGGDRADDAMRQVALDVQSYYSLAYKAGTQFDKPHRVTVRVKNRPELNVRARNEVVRKSPQREMNDRLVAGLVTESMKNELGIAARAGEPEKGKERGLYSIDVDVLIPLWKLTFLREGDTQRARFTVHYAITGNDTGFVSGIEPMQDVEIPLKEFDAARAKIWRHTLHVNMNKGEHYVAVGVLDALSQTAGMAALKLEAR